MSRRLACSIEDVRSRIALGMRYEDICAELKISMGTLHRKRILAGVTTNRGRRHTLAGPPRSVRHDHGDTLDRTPSMPALSTAALNEKRTMYPSTVTPIAGVLNVLVDGVNARKIGNEVRKGAWKGFHIYTLTLEERATCPTACALWRSCYGNSMHFAKRLEHGKPLEDRLWHELSVLNSRHPKGFAVRLHVLGDFYSVNYACMWRDWLRRLPALHVFGFTARYQDDDPIAVALKDIVKEFWPRFGIRFSNAPKFTGVSTVTIEHPFQKPPDAIICPQQLGKTETCGTCALCWQTTRPIAFLRH